MPYATVQDVTDRLGREFVDQLADEPAADPPAYRALESALADASEEIDGYVGSRHALPLDPAPAVLTRVCIQIGVYLRCQGADLATDEQKDRAEQARKFLRDVASGLVSLGPSDPDPPASAAEPGIRFVSSPRQFGRDKGLL